MEEKRKVEHRKFERGRLAQYLTIAQVATRLGLSRPTIYSMVKKGKLPASLIGGQWFVAPSAVDALLPPGTPEAEAPSAPAASSTLEQAERSAQEAAMNPNSVAAAVKKAT